MPHENDSSPLVLAVEGPEQDDNLAVWTGQVQAALVSKGLHNIQHVIMMPDTSKPHPCRTFLLIFIGH